MEGVLLNCIENEIEKAEVKPLTAGNPMPADSDKLLGKVSLTLSSGDKISSWISNIKGRAEVSLQGFSRRAACISDSLALLLWCHQVDRARD